MGGGADGEDPGGTPPPEDVAGIDLDPAQHSKDEPEPDPVAAHGTADAQSESIGTEDSASEDDADANEHEHEPLFEPDDGFEQMVQDITYPAGVPWPGIPDEWSDDDSGESDAESGEFSYDDSDGDDARLPRALPRLFPQLASDAVECIARRLAALEHARAAGAELFHGILERLRHREALQWHFDGFGLGDARRQDDGGLAREVEAVK